MRSRWRMMRRRRMMMRMMRRGIATVERGRGREIGWRRGVGGGGGVGSGGFPLLRLILLTGVVGVGSGAEFEVGSGARVVVSAPPAPHEHGVVGPLKLRRVRTRLGRRRLRPARRRRRTAGGGGRRAAGIQVRFRL